MVRLWRTHQPRTAPTLNPSLSPSAAAGPGPPAGPSTPSPTPPTAPNAASAKPGAAAGTANAARSGTGWGNALRSIGFLAGGMLLGSMLASMFGLGSGFLADILGVLANVALVFIAVMAIRWIWNRFRGRKEEENVYRSAPRRQDIAPRPTVTDIRPQGVSAPLPTDINMDDSPRSIADCYRNR